MVNNMAVTVSNVSKSFGEIKAVSNLSINISMGTIYGLLGPNGSGKSTTMKMIMGLLEPDEGSIDVYGLNPKNDAYGLKKIIGYVPEEPHLYEFLTAMEYLEFIATIHEVDENTFKAKVVEFLKAFELKGHEHEVLGGYSHGMKQKIAITTALLTEPRLLILDEPLAGLDPKSAKIMKDLLNRLTTEGVTVIFSTHVLEIAEAICDNVGILYKGELLTEGTAYELKQLSETPEGTLEEAFLKLTDSSNVWDIVEALAR
jgi:ABC-2 type transport system ATP-binding protein